MSPIRGQLPSTTISVHYDRILAATTSSMTLNSCWPISFRCTSTGYVKVTTPRKSVSVGTRFLRYGTLSPQQTLWKAVPTSKNLSAPPPGTLTSSCSISSNQQTFLVEMVQNLPNALGLCDTLGLGDGGVWVDPDGGCSRFVSRLAWPREIVEDLVSWSKPWGKITNYYLELVVLGLQQSWFYDVCSDHHWHEPATRSNNTPTVRWNLCKSSAVNPVVVYLLRLRLICNINATILISVFFHPGLENNMDDESSCNLIYVIASMLILGLTDIYIHNNVQNITSKLPQKN